MRASQPYPSWKYSPSRDRQPDWVDGVVRAFADAADVIDSRRVRPVLFGEQGEEEVRYEVDGWHPGHGAVLEVEAGRGAMNHADYRDIIRASLVVDVRYLVLATQLSYGKDHVPSSRRTRSSVDAIYASERLTLPLDGLLLIGY